MQAGDKAGGKDKQTADNQTLLPHFLGFYYMLTFYYIPPDYLHPDNKSGHWDLLEGQQVHQVRVVMTTDSGKHSTFATLPPSSQTAMIFFSPRWHCTLTNLYASSHLSTNGSTVTKAACNLWQPVNDTKVNISRSSTTPPPHSQPHVLFFKNFNLSPWNALSN